jgi:hypothetical protein
MNPNNSCEHRIPNQLVFDAEGKLSAWSSSTPHDGHLCLVRLSTANGEYSCIYPDATDTDCPLAIEAREKLQIEKITVLQRKPSSQT